MIVVRYADDLIVGVEHEAEARRFWDAMRIRFEQFSLELQGARPGCWSSVVTRLNGGSVTGRANRRPSTFWDSRSSVGARDAELSCFDVIRDATACERPLREVKDELRRRRHDSLADQGRWLRSVVTGYFAYHAVPTNAQAIGAYRHHIIDLWRRSLKRRSQKDRMTWARIDRLAKEWLPPPHVLHPWPEDRMAVRHPR